MFINHREKGTPSIKLRTFSEKQECNLSWHSGCPCIVNLGPGNKVIQLDVNV